MCNDFAAVMDSAIEEEGRTDCAGEYTNKISASGETLRRPSLSPRSSHLFYGCYRLLPSPPPDLSRNKVLLEGISVKSRPEIVHMDKKHRVLLSHLCGASRGGKGVCHKDLAC